MADLRKNGNNGGVRAGAGRKPVTDKLLPVVVYVRKSVIDKHGKDKLKAVFLRALADTNV